MKKISVVLFLFFAVVAKAQEDQIDTDRPDQTETPSIVSQGHFQMENGFTHKHEVSDNVERFELPSSLWKFGLVKNLELRIITTLLYENGPQEDITGLEPIIIGVKQKICDERGIVPKTSVISQVSIPDLASAGLKTVHLGPEVRLLMQNTISKNIDLSYNMGVQWDGEDTRPQYNYTFSPSFDIDKMLKAYIESYGFIKVGRHPENWIDGGFMLLLSNDVQLDIAGGYEISNHTGNKHGTFESIGFSFRI
jgi:hypothetical protein